MQRWLLSDRQTDRRAIQIRAFCRSLLRWPATVSRRMVQAHSSQTHRSFLWPLSTARSSLFAIVNAARCQSQFSSTLLALRELRSSLPPGASRRYVQSRHFCVASSSPNIHECHRVQFAAEWARAMASRHDCGNWIRRQLVPVHRSACHRFS